MTLNKILPFKEKRMQPTVLHNKKDNVKCTLHYDLTQRSKIDGDQPCLILIFSDNQRFSLCSLFFAYEDRKRTLSD